jgi:hypothetical protein
MRVISYFVLVLLSFRAWSDQELTYKVPSYPLNGRDCHEVAREIGESFGAATGLKVTTAYCSQASEKYGNLEINYMAEKVVTLVTTRHPYAVLPLGRFVDEKTCLASMPKDRALFESATGLVPFIAYCAEVQSGRKYPWTLHMDAAGKAKLEPWLGGFLLFSVPQEITLAHFRAAIRKKLSETGSLVMDVVLQGNAGLGELAVHYFSEGHITFTAKETGKLPNKAQCLQEAADFSSIVGSTVRAPQMVYCGRTFLGTWEVTNLYIGQDAPAPLLSLDKFTTYEECRANKARVVEHYKTTLKMPVIGGVCTLASRAYQVYLVR